MSHSTHHPLKADRTGLAAKYTGKFLVLTDERPGSAYDCWDDAFFDAMQHLDPGTFLIVQAVTGAPGADPYDGCQDELSLADQGSCHI